MWEWGFLALFPLLALLLLWDVLAGGRVLLPAVFLKTMSPWSTAFTDAQRQALPQWNILQWDGMAEFYPWRLYAARSIAAGRIPLWDPHVLCGTPFLADSQSAPLYPVHLLYYLPLGASTAVRMGWVAWLHLSLAGLFAYCWARDLGARPAAALLGGTAFELSGFAVAWLELPSFLSVACWIPLVLLCTARAVRHGSWRWAVGAGAAAGMMLLAGHLQIAFYGLLAAGCIWLWETVLGVGRSALGVRESLTLGVGIVTLALALAAPQLLPSVELSRISHRAGVSTEAGFAGYVRLALRPPNWITLLVPDYFGLPARGDFWGQSRYGAAETMEYAGWVGSGAFLLAVMGLVWGRRVDQRALLLAGLGLLALLLATGSPLAMLLYFGVPGFGQTGSPARVLVLFCLAQAMLAALGVEWLLRRAEQRWSGVLQPLGAGLAATLLLILVLHAVSQAALPIENDEAVRQVAVPALVRAALYAAGTAFLVALMARLFHKDTVPQRLAAVSVVALLLVGGGLLFLGAPYNVTSPVALVYPTASVVQELQRLDGRVATLNRDRDWPILGTPTALLPPNSPLAYGWRDAQGYDSLMLGSYRRLVNDILAPEDASPPANGNIVFIKNAASPLFPLLGARYVVSPAPLSGPTLQPVGEQSAAPPFVYELPEALPEAETVRTWIVAEDQAGLDQLRRNPGQISYTALLPPGAPAPPSSRPTPGQPRPEPVRVNRISPQRITVAVPAAHGGLLVLREVCAPGWKAVLRVPGAAPRLVPILRADVAFQAVLLPASVPATVEWRYEPASFRCGLFLGFCALALLLAMLLAGARTGVHRPAAA